jgi:hypothetical protein
MWPGITAGGKKPHPDMRTYQDLAPYPTLIFPQNSLAAVCPGHRPLAGAYSNSL